jgi:hypothetical protein
VHACPSPIVRRGGLAAARDNRWNDGARTAQRLVPLPSDRAIPTGNRGFMAAKIACTFRATCNDCAFNNQIVLRNRIPALAAPLSVSVRKKGERKDFRQRAIQQRVASTSSSSVAQTGPPPHPVGWRSPVQCDASIFRNPWNEDKAGDLGRWHWSTRTASHAAYQSTVWISDRDREEGDPGELGS